MSSRQSVVVLGGAGFIGSHIVERFGELGNDVTVIDGLLPNTGGARENLQHCRAHVRFIELRVEDVRNLGDILGQADVIVDCMAWTSHMDALGDPELDLRLNATSHLHVVRTLQPGSRAKIIYLGSRGQYGNPEVAEIDETTSMLPVDVQG